MHGWEYRRVDGWMCECVVGYMDELQMALLDG